MNEETSETSASGTTPETTTQTVRRRRSSHHRHRHHRHGSSGRTYEFETPEHARKREDWIAVTWIVPVLLLSIGFALWYVSHQNPNPSERPEGLMTLSYALLLLGGGMLALALIAGWVRKTAAMIRDSREIARDARRSVERGRHHHHHHHRSHHEASSSGGTADTPRDKPTP